MIVNYDRKTFIVQATGLYYHLSDSAKNTLVINLDLFWTQVFFFIPGTNTLAYFSFTVRSGESFMPLTPGLRIKELLVTGLDKVDDRVPAL